MNESTFEGVVEDEATAEALATVLAQAEATDGTVTWSQVRESVDSEVWGRLLATDVLVATGDRFVVDDPVALRAALAAEGYEISVDRNRDSEEPAGWRPRDKAAGVGALVLAAGYQVSAIKSPVVGVMDAVLGPAAAVVPFPLLILGIALGTATVSTGLRRRLLDTDEVERTRERLQTVRDRLEGARERDDGEAIDSLEAEQRDLARSQFSVLAKSLRPMVWTMLVSIPVFLWLSWLVVSPSAAIAHATPLIPALDRIVWTARVVGPMQLWMVWYVGCQLASSLLIRRGVDRIQDRYASTL